MDGINLKNVPVASKNSKSNFDLSFSRAFDHKFGDLVPVCCVPTIPGDKFSFYYEFLNRMAPFISQVFQDYKVKFDFFFVPDSVVYNNFELFMSAGYDGNHPYVHPFINPGVVQGFCSANFNHSIFDYLDISPSVFGANQSTLATEHWNALPFAAYIQTYLDYYLPPDTSLNKIKQKIISDEYVVTDGDMTNRLSTLFGAINSNDPDWVLGDGPYDPAGLFALFKMLYPLDYFTSARANAQLGPVMTIPLSLVNTDSLTGSRTFQIPSSGTSGNAPLYVKQTNNSRNVQIYPQDEPNKRVSINASIFENYASINDFYSAARLQELLTLYNYSGFTPSKRIAAEFGVNNPDSRLHQSQWLHSSIHDVSIGEVFSNNVNANTSDLKDLAGVGTAISSTGASDQGFVRKVDEFGFMVGLMSVYPEASYSQGIPRLFSISDRFDYPHPLLSEIGMTAIRQKELIADFSNQSDWNSVFGYMSQYGDSKVGINRINGSLRNSLKFMSAGRLFEENNGTLRTYEPHYNDEFLKVLPSRNGLNRTFNVVSSYSHDCPLLSKVNFQIYVERQLPYYGLPRF